MKKIILTFALIFAMSFSSHAGITVKNNAAEKVYRNGDYTISVFFDDDTVINFSWSENTEMVEMWFKDPMNGGSEELIGGHQSYNGSEEFWADDSKVRYVIVLRAGGEVRINGVDYGSNSGYYSSGGPILIEISETWGYNYYPED